MLLTEAAGKRLLREHAVPTPAGVELTLGQDPAVSAFPPFPLAVKAQVAVGGRGKVGGVVRCQEADKLSAAVNQVLSLDFGGLRANSVLVEPWLDIARELYLSLVVDTHADGYAFLYAPDGGVDVELSGSFIKYPIGRLADYRAYVLRSWLVNVEGDPALVERLLQLAGRLVRMAKILECTTIEINPLALLSDGSLIAADAKVVLDDAAAFRQPGTAAVLDEARDGSRGTVRACSDANLVFVPLDGSVGLVSGGAGMTMAAMDALADAGCGAACFLDISANPTPTGLEVAMTAVINSPDIDAVLISIFGGGLFVDRIARTVLALLERSHTSKPVVFRLAGAGRAEATRLLAEANRKNHATLGDAVAAVVGELPVRI